MRLLRRLSRSVVRAGEPVLLLTARGLGYRFEDLPAEV
jgi:hypothetical protein